MVERTARVIEIVVLIVTTTLYVVTVFLNYWSSSDNSEDLGFKDTVGNISDRYRLQVTPAGWTFSIWAVIYVWQLLWLIYGWSFVFRPKSAKIIPLLTYVLFTISCAFNIGWIYAFTNSELIVAFVLLFLLTLTLYGTIGVSVVVFYYRVEYLKREKQWIDLVVTTALLHNGLAVYATWTSVATLLNMGIIMRYTGPYKMDIDATTIGLVVLSILGLEIIVWFLLANTILDRFVRYIFTVYPVLVWALAGVVAKNIDDDSLDKTNYTAVGALVLSGLLFVIQLVLSIVNCKLRKLKYPNIRYRAIQQ